MPPLPPAKAAGTTDRTCSDHNSSTRTRPFIRAQDTRRQQVFVKTWLVALAGRKTTIAGQTGGALAAFSEPQHAEKQGAKRRTAKCQPKAAQACFDYRGKHRAPDIIALLASGRNPKNMRGFAAFIRPGCRRTCAQHRSVAEQNWSAGKRKRSRSRYSPTPRSLMPGTRASSTNSTPKRA